MDSYLYAGARALVLLHERHLGEFVQTWKRAQAANVTIPENDDPNYDSLELILRHVLRAARGYMVWMCRELELPDPDLRPAPAADAIEAEADAYLEHILEGWRAPLREVESELFHHPTFESAWGVEYCIDAMLEHAVMHPIRHSFQLEEWMRPSA